MGIGVGAVGLGSDQVFAGSFRNSAFPTNAGPVADGAPDWVPTSPPATAFATSPSTPPRTPRPGSLELRPVDRPEDRSGLHDVWVYQPDVPDSADLPVVYFQHPAERHGPPGP